jgi:hypothetical protein
MKTTVLGAAGGAVLGGMSAISCMSLAVFTKVFAKSVANSLAGRSEPYTFNANTIPEGFVLKAVCIGIVLGGLAGLVTAVVANYFSSSKNDSN